MAGYKELLVGNRNYRLWFISGLGSSFGDWIGLFALQVLVVSLAPAGSRLALFGLGGVMMARLLPSAIFGPIAGVVADRYDRRRLMFVADIVRGALFVVVAFSRDLVTLLVLTFVIECLSLLFIAAKDASLPQIVERRHLTQANQMNLFVTYGPLPLGALTATVLVSIAGFLAGLGLPDVGATTFSLLVNAATFFIAGLVILGLRLPPKVRRATDADGQAPGVWEELRAGLRFIRDLPLIRALITGVVGVAFGAGVVVALGPEFVRSDLGLPEADWFTLVAFVGTGLLLGILLVPVITNHVRKERLFPPCLTGAAAAGVVIATLPSLQLASMVGFLLGGLVGISFVSGYTLLHEQTTDDMRARTFAAFYTSTRVAMFAALGLGPMLAGLIGRFSIGAGGRFATMSGVRLTMLAGGIAALLSAISAWRAMDRAVRQRDSAGDRAGGAGGAGGAGRTLRLPLPRAEPTPGVFVALEGGEGAGKSTQMGLLAATLRAEGHDVLATREPGGPPVSERVREILLDPASGAMEARTETLLYAAARAEHVEAVIRPALSAGTVVICDRFLDSSVAYQGFARGLGEDAVYEINRWAVGGIEPDVVVLLDLDVEEGLRRAVPGSGHDGGDRIEREDSAFHERVADGFRSLADRDDGRVVVVDGRGEPEVVAERVRAALTAWLPLPVDGDGPVPADGDGPVPTDGDGPVPAERIEEEGNRR
ncbi:MAG: dTMP kinase [Egibacteraceae bacterium]